MEGSRMSRPPLRRTILATLALVASTLASAGSLPEVGLFTTGGTIQSKGAHRQKLMEYNEGRVTPDELLGDLPELQQIAHLSVTEESNVGSGNIDAQVLL